MAHRSSASRPRSTDLDTLKKYQFRPLKPGEKMRVLKILSASNREDTVVCELLHKPVYKRKEASNPRLNGNLSRSSSLVNPQPARVMSGAAPSDAGNDKGRPSAGFEAEKFSYDALSYRWGIGNFNQSIRIHEGDGVYHFQVHEHLYEALQELRAKDKIRYLWVDAICIDQDFSPERSQQVARMNEVYGDADQVCIWLGNEADGSTEGLQLLKGEKIGLNVYDFDKNCMQDTFVRAWASLLQLLKREWFSRRWVVQEVSLAQRATVHCGSTSVDWVDLAAAVSLLNDVDAAAKRLSEAAKKIESLGHPRDLFAEVGALTATRLVTTASRLFRRSIGGQHQRVSTLEDIVARLAMFQTSEPKDYIYALLALAKDSQPYAGIPDYLDGAPLTTSQQKSLLAVLRLLPSIYRERYDVDYKQEVVQVYQNFIQFAMSKSDPALALDVIFRPFAPPSVLNLPSWVPNISDLSHTTQPIINKESFNMERQRGDPFVSMPDTSLRYSAAGRKPLEKAKLRFRRRKNHYSMFVEGFVLDTVKRIEVASQLGNIPEEWFALARQHAERQKDPEAFWRTLVADRGPKGDVPDIYKNVIVPALQVASGLNIGSHIQAHHSSIVSDAWPHVQATIWGRCLFETSLCHLGLGPKKLQTVQNQGSRLLVCILHGCTVPIILQEYLKTAEEIAEEQREDKDDLEDRLNRAVDRPIFKKLRNKWMKRIEEKRTKTAQNGDAMIRAQPEAEIKEPVLAEAPTASESDEPSLLVVPAKPPRSVTWTVFLSHRHTGGALTMLASAVLIAFIFGERLAAGILLLFVAPWVTSDWINDRAQVLSKMRLQRKSQGGPFLMLSGSISLTVMLGMGKVELLVMFAAVALTDALFFELLPTLWAETYKSVLSTALEFSLADIPKMLWKVSPVNRSQEYDQNDSETSIQAGMNSAKPSRPVMSPEERGQCHEMLIDVIGANGPNYSQISLIPVAEPAVTNVTPDVIANANANANTTSAGTAVDTIAETASEAAPAPASSTVPIIATDGPPVSRYYYKVIGESYVHNMMMGEAIKWQNDTVVGPPEQRVLTQTFELR